MCTEAPTTEDGLKKRPIIYIAGPMTGIQDSNYPAFFEAQKLLERAGYTVLNPATVGKRDSWEEYMRATIPMMLQADAVACLPDWPGSRGAMEEYHIAVDVIKMPWRSLSYWVFPPKPGAGKASEHMPRRPSEWSIR